MMSFLSQAPASMKSVLQSFWLLTVAFGDLIVVILASVLPAMGVVSQSKHRTDWETKEFLCLYEKKSILKAITEEEIWHSEIASKSQFRKTQMGNDV